MVGGGLGGGLSFGGLSGICVGCKVGCLVFQDRSRGWDDVFISFFLVFLGLGALLG